jgi:hypothetical protein
MKTSSLRCTLPSQSYLDSNRTIKVIFQIKVAVPLIDPNEMLQ